MGFSSTAANQALDALSGGATNVLAYVSCHTADPGTTGASEYAGVTRQACSWNAAASRAKTNSSALSITTSGASQVTWFGTFSASSSGVFGAGLQLSTPVQAASITVAAGALSISA